MLRLRTRPDAAEESRFALGAVCCMVRISYAALPGLSRSSFAKARSSLVKAAGRLVGARGRNRAAVCRRYRQ